MPSGVSRKDLLDWLRDGRNPDGGWGYYRGKTSRLEPTCWALLACASGPDDWDVLRRWPAPDHLLLERPAGTVNYAFHGLALLALHASGEDHVRGNVPLLGALQREHGIALGESQINRQDNTLQAWPWFPGTFSWLEPTAWCLLALKRWRREAGAAVDPARIDVAERLIVDRVCLDGGWNYGNSNMLGQELKPYVPTTALALLAMRDRPGEPSVERSLAWLERQATSERSASALGLALMALAAFDRPIEPVRRALDEQLPTAIELGNHAAVGLAACALAGPEGHAFAG